MATTNLVGAVNAAGEGRAVAVADPHVVPSAEAAIGAVPQPEVIRAIVSDYSPCCGVPHRCR